MTKRELVLMEAANRHLREIVRDMQSATQTEQMLILGTALNLVERLERRLQKERENAALPVDLRAIFPSKSGDVIAVFRGLNMLRREPQWMYEILRAAPSRCCC